jgi:hypothetical protein
MDIPLSFTVLNTKTQKKILICVDSPTTFQLDNIDKILPNWNKTLKSTIVILQEANLDLSKTSPKVDKEKNCLRFNYIDVCCNLVKEAEKYNISLEPLDPRNGKALFSKEGEIPHDDAVVAFCILIKEIIEIKLETKENCKVIYHSKWGFSNYPSIILADAAPKETFEMVKNYYKGQKLCYTIIDAVTESKINA